MPTYSIVIPTRNRPDLVATAIQSVLSNTYGGFEVIVADNSDAGLRIKDNPDRTRIGEDEYTSRVTILPPHPTHHYSMWDNYRRGAAAAQGKWVIMMNDKCIMSPWALDLLVHAINQAEQRGAEVITWPVPFKYSFSPRRKPGEGSHSVSTLDIYDAFELWDYTNPYEWDVFPHGCNCCYKKFLGHESMYRARNPDYLQGDHLIAIGKHVWFTQDDIMFIPRGIPVRYSVGGAYNSNANTYALMEYKADCAAVSRPVTNDYSFENVIEDMDMPIWPAKEHFYKAGVYRAAIDRALAGGGSMRHRYLTLLEFSPRAAWITLRRLVRDMLRRFTV